MIRFNDNDRNLLLKKKQWGSMCRAIVVDVRNYVELAMSQIHCINIHAHLSMFKWIPFVIPQRIHGLFNFDPRPL